MFLKNIKAKKVISLVTAMVISWVAVSVSVKLTYDEVYATVVNNTVEYGDINDDEKIDAFDAVVLKKHLLYGNSVDTTVADLNADGKVDKTDLRLLNDYVLGKSTSFPVYKMNATSAIKDDINQMDFSVISSIEPVETKLTTEMARVIDELGTPVAVYEYLINMIQTEFYAGSRKGAIGTYEQLGGNNVDSASLLIAALRYMGYEANYVTGTVEITPEQAMNLTATTNIDKALEVLNIQGGKSLTQMLDPAGQVVAARMEHTWVEAVLPSSFVDGGNSSNALVTVQLDLSFKKKYRISLANMLNNNGVTNSDIKNLEEAIASNNSFIADKIINDIVSNSEGLTIDDMVLETKPSSVFEKLHAVLPYEVLGEDNKFSNVTLEMSDYVDFYIDGRSVARLTSAEIHGKRLVIEYGFDSNSQELCELLDMFGESYPRTILDIPKFAGSSLGNFTLQANLKLDGKVVGSGSSTTLGTQQDLIMKVRSGITNTTLESFINAGSMYAVTVDTQSISSNEILKSSQAIARNIAGNASFDSMYNDNNLGTTLSEIGKMYMGQLDLANQMFGEQYNVYSERNLSICVTTFNLDIWTDFLGRVSLNRQGTLGIDAQLLDSVVVSLDNNAENLSTYRMQTGVKSSYLESDVLESVTGVEGISTMKIFDISREQGIDIISISQKSANYTDLLNSLSITTSAYNDVVDAVNSGYEVLVPVRNVTVNSWTGTGFVIIEGDGETYTFRLSNGTSGGETAVPLSELSVFIEDVVFWSYFITLAMASVKLILAGQTFAAALAILLESTAFQWTSLKTIIVPLFAAFASFLMATNALNKYAADETTVLSEAGKVGSAFWSLIGKRFLDWVIG